MKKVLLLFVSVLFISFVSCSDDEDNVSEDKKKANIVSPPAWIHGTWEKDFGWINGVRAIKRYTFTEDDIVDFNQRMIEGDPNDDSEKYTTHFKNYDKGKKVTETNEPNKYTVIVEYLNNGKIFTYSFEKTEENKIKVSGSNNGIFTKK